MRKLIVIAMMAALAAAAQNAKFRPVFSAGPKPIGPYSPALWAGDRLYVSGQGARNAAGELPATPEGQIRQTLENVKQLVEAGGLSMEHVAFSHVYLADLAHYELLNKVWAEFFPRHKPARSTVGVALMPGGTPFEINAVAVRQQASLKALQLPGAVSPVPLSPAVQTADRVYVSGILGRDAAAGVIPAAVAAQVETAFARMRGVLGAGGLGLGHLISLNVYTTAAMPDDVVAAVLAKHLPNRDNVAITAIRVPALPFGANVAIHGVATRTLGARERHGNCVSAGSTIFCGQVAADDYRPALTGLIGLVQKFSPGAVIVASFVNLDDLKEFPVMNGVYAEVMGAPLPTRTTLQPGVKGEGPRFRMGVVAER